MFVEIVRLLIVLVATALAHELTSGVAGAPATAGILIGAGFGYVMGGIFGRFLVRATGVLERRVTTRSGPELVVGALGAAAGSAFAGVGGLPAALLLQPQYGLPLFALSAWTGGYIGFHLTARKSRQILGLAGLEPRATYGTRRFGDAPTSEDSLLLDTSVLLDGRLLAVADAGFIRGDLLIPRFVLDELQSIADAQDPTRRRRGRRGLEILDALGSRRGVRLHVLDDELPEVDEVDAKLVALGSRMSTALMTADQPLARVAELQGVRVVSMHRLASSLSPALIAGEICEVTIAKTGKESGQGVGFLDDGAMVVVADADHLVGETIAVRIVSSVKTSVGRMFFASTLSADHASEDLTPHT